MTLQEVITAFMEKQGYSNENFITVQGWKIIAEEFAKIKSQSKPAPEGQ